MTNKAQRPRRAPGPRVVLGWLAVLFVVPAIFYVVYVFDQIEEIESYNIDLLYSAARRVEDTLEQSEKNVRNLRSDFRFPLAQRQPFLSERTTRGDSKRLADPRDWESQSEQTCKERHSQSHPECDESCLETWCREERAKLAEGIDLRTGFDLDGLDLVLRASAEVRGEHYELGFKVLLDPIFERRYFGDLFDHLALADHRGRVVWQQAVGEDHHGLWLTRLDTLLVGGGGEAAKETGKEGSAEKKTKDEERSDGSPEQKSNDAAAAVPEYGKLISASLLRDVEVVEEDFRLFCQPLGVKLFEPDPEGGETRTVAWPLCGLVATDHVWRQAQGVAPLLVLSLILILTLGLLTWPLIKLFLSDRRERFKVIDAYLLWLSTFALLLFAFVLLYDASSYLELRGRTGTSLGRLADDVEERFLRELSRLHDQLATWDRELLAKGRRPQPSSEDTDLLVRQRGISTLGLSQPAYPYFTSVFWMDKEGRQFAKGTIRRENTPPVSLEHRPYFRAVREDSLWSFDDASEELREKLEAAPPGAEPGCPQPAGFFFQTYDSVTTGKRSSALSIRSCLSALEPEELVVAAITSEPISVMHPVLPTGFGFAIVDAAGLSLFHSDAKLALEETLPHRMTGGDRLWAAMASGSPQSFATRYHTRPHLVFVRPLEVVPWWIVTFYDQEILGTANLEAVAHALIVALSYLILISLPLFVLGVLYSRHAEWLWPDGAKRGMYRRTAVQCGVLLGFVALLLRLSGEGREWLAVSAGVLGGLVALGNYLYWRRYETGEDNPSRPAGSRCLGWHVAAAVLLWGLLAVLPGLGFFQAAWRQQLGVVAAREGIHLLQALGDNRGPREQALEELYSYESAEKKLYLPADFLDRRRRLLEDVYLRRDVAGEPAPVLDLSVSLDRASRPGNTDDFAASALWRELARFKPIYNRSSRELRYLAVEPPRGSFDVWRSDSGIEIQGPGVATGQKVRVSVSLADSGPWAGWPSLLGGLVLLVVLVVWIRFSARNIFLGRIPRQKDPIPVATLAGVDRPVIALFACPRDRREILDSEEVRRVDLGGTDRQAVLRRIRSLSPEDARPVVCDNFESGFDDPEVRAWKQEALEELLVRARRRVVVSAVLDPFARLFRHGPTRGGPAGAESTADEPGFVRLRADEADRWSRLLSELEVELVGRASPLELPDPEAREALVERKEGYYWALWSSCSPDERLTVFHLAQENFVNPKQWRTVRRLLRRGLLKRDPMLRLSDRCLDLFVREVLEPQAVERWERDVRGVGWQQMRWAVLSILAVIALFLYATHQAFFDATLGFLSALALGVPGLLKLIGSLLRRETGDIAG